MAALDLSLDPDETTDLAIGQPERLKTLIVQWRQYASVNGVVPPDTPTFYSKPPRKQDDGNDQTADGAING